ncbi:AfsR/SARP family transcriptional regulator [Stackebrandtia nassauensis]|uniref:Transcriptional regulator, SARP family n=1 Tax=Stackebrandtia nassauensis (strain DSM 44728 / CIP 108903 / NRRL B-16338 / NBRC 102104 / LLR-40K-21) TaxID=446470 RepID=D3PZJ5_STANL|nr:BTAD domain-containing putative transcriptional regulator [Stackebrandtia nassauensis]ADD41669.1 transcriptional regulator, SARP family [Stackebrandtia nassauensis DSM 44728]
MLVRLLGGVEVAGAEGQWRTVPGKRAGVLAVLAVAAGEPVPADELVHRVWGASAVALADGAVYPHITRLRATLSPAGLTISRARGGYVLDLDADQVDLLTIRALAVRAREAAETGEDAKALTAWQRATALLRGEALAGVDGDWAERFRQSFGGEARSLLAERYGWELRWGRHHAVVDELLAAMVRYPTCESLAEHLMLALYRCGRQAEALAVFDRTARLLRDRLGVDPSESLRRLHRRILNQDAGLAAPEPMAFKTTTSETTTVDDAPADTVVPAQLPAPPRAFVGRESELAALKRDADRTSVLILDGMPGVGKTATAVRLATELAQRYPDGQLFLDLHGYSGDVPAVEPAEALVRLLRGLGAEADQIPTGLDERSAELRTRLAGRRVLILLDNAATSAQVRPLLPGGTDCLTIITSRRRLPDLLEAAPASLDVLEPEEAVRLLVAAVDDPKRVAEDSADTAAIVEVAGRLPLAIRLIAARLRNRRNWTAGFMLGRLRDETILSELSAQDVAVASAFSMSYAELDDGHRRMFRLLGLFPGQDFDATFAAALADVAPEAADRMLEDLVDAHLLRSAEPGRYRFHDLMRHYAATIATETETAAEVEAARTRLYDTAAVMLRHAISQYDSYVGYYPRLIEAVDPPESPWRTRAEASAWFGTELPNLKAMLRSANEHRMDRHCAEMAAAMSAYYSHHHADHDLDRIGEWGLGSARRIGDRECEGYFLNKLAGAYQAWGDVGMAERLHEQALAVRRELGDARYIVSSLSNLALVHGHSGEYDRAVELRGEALALAADNGLVELERLICVYMAGSLCESGRIAEARLQLERAGELLTGSDDAFARMSLDAHWGNVKRGEGDPVEAQRLHERALAAYETHGHSVGQVQMHSEIASDLIARELWDEAWKSCVTSMELLGDTERPELRAENLLTMAEVCLARGHDEDAFEQLSAVADLAESRDSAVLRAKADWGLARVASAKGDNENAVQHAERALAYYSRFDTPRTEAIRRFLSQP